MLLSDNWDYWNVPVHGGAATNLTVNGKRDKIHYLGRIRLDPDEKGADLEKPLYYRVIGEWTKKTGFARVESGKPGAQMLTWDDASYGSLMKAKRAGQLLKLVGPSFTRSARRRINTLSTSRGWYLPKL